MTISRVGGVPLPFTSQAGEPNPLVQEKLDALIRAAANGSEAPPQTHADYARAFLASIAKPGQQPGVLNLTEAAGPAVRWLEQLPPQAWSLVGDLVAAVHGADLCELTLPRAMSRTPVQGLKQLTSLRTLTTHVGKTEELDLTQMFGLERVNLRLLGPESCVHAKVCNGVFVRMAAQMDPPALERSTVRYYENGALIPHKDERCPPRVPSGLLWQYAGQHDSIFDGPLAQQEAYLIRLNGEGKSPMGPAHDGSGDGIVCSHLAVQWLVDQAASKQSVWDSKDSKDSKESKAPPFSYQAYRSADRIGRHVQRDLMEDYLDKLLSKPRIRSDVSEQCLGQMLKDKFEKMKESESLFFMVVTPTHAMALRLDVAATLHGKQRRQEYSFALYDPNLTATHVCGVFEKDDARLGELALTDCIDTKAAMTYFRQSGVPDNMARAPIFSIYPWAALDGAALDGAAPPARDFVDDHHQASLDYLRLKANLQCFKGLANYFSAASRFLPTDVRSTHIAVLAKNMLPPLTIASGGFLGIQLRAPAHQYLSEILESGFLSDESKFALCTTPDGGIMHLAREGLKNKLPMFAGAVACAIVEARNLSAGLRAALLNQLGIDAHALVKVLTAKRAEPEPVEWGLRLDKALAAWKDGKAPP